MVGLVEASAGVGTTIGPVLGSTLYILTNYAGTFYVYGAINFIFAGLLIIFFPKDLRVGNNKAEREIPILAENTESEFAPNDDEFKGEVTYCGLMSRGRYFMAMTSSSVCYFAYCMLEPILAERLIEFNLNQA